MADDIFLTPEEQDERARQWLKDNGLALGLGIALGLGAVFGYNQYQDKQKSDAEMASKLFNQSLQRMNDSELADIDTAVASLKADHANTSYAAKAALLKAKQLSVSDLEAAVTELQWIIDNANESGLQHTARVRKAKALLSLGKVDEAIAEASAQPQDGFASHYQEILGDAALAQGDHELARASYEQAMQSLSGGDAAYQSVLQLKINRLPSEAEQQEVSNLDQPSTEG